MGTEGTHILQANRNQVVLERLIADPDPPSDWIAIVAFYKALHIVEAVLACQEAVPDNHSVDHKSRNYLLKIKYPDIWNNYSILYRNSLVARYLEIGSTAVPQRYTTFSRFLSHEKLLEET